MNKQHTIIVGGFGTDDSKKTEFSNLIEKFENSGADIRRISGQATYKTIAKAGKRVTPTRRTLVVIEDVCTQARLIKKGDSYVEDTRYGTFAAVNELLATAESGVHVVVTADTWTTNAIDIIAA